MSSPFETTDAPAQPISKSNLRQQVTAWLMTAIFQGRYRSGQRLIVQQIANACHASPTPIREALVELASLGLVELVPNRGAVVQPFGPREIVEISEVRRLLEVEAALSPMDVSPTRRWTAWSGNSCIWRPCPVTRSGTDEPGRSITGCTA